MTSLPGSAVPLEDLKSGTVGALSTKPDSAWEEEGHCHSHGLPDDAHLLAFPSGCDRRQEHHGASLIA